MNKITYNDIPEAISIILNTINEIQKFLLSNNLPAPPSKIDNPLTVKEAAEFLSLSVPTIYALIAKGEIPVLKRSKRCYFLKEDLVKYLKEGKKKTTSDIEAEADQFLSTRKRKGVRHA